MSEWLSYLYGGIDYSDLTVLDAATGAGGATLELAKRIAEADGGGKVISVDIDPEAFPYAKEKLGKFARLVEFVEADLTCMPQIESESCDLVVCTLTLCALNDRPLKALRGLVEFHRVLKKGGHLRIAEDYPLPKATRPEEEVQAMRWQLHKCVAELVDGERWTEIYPEEVEFAASLIGFQDIEWKRFPPDTLKKNTMEEWKEVMPRMIDQIEDEQTRNAFLALTSETYKKFEEQGGMGTPSYVMRMRK